MCAAFKTAQSLWNLRCTSQDSRRSESISESISKTVLPRTIDLHAAGSTAFPRLQRF